MGKLECVPCHAKADHLEPHILLSVPCSSEHTADLAVVALLVAVNRDWLRLDTGRAKARRADFQNAWPVSGVSIPENRTVRMPWSGVCNLKVSPSWLETTVPVAVKGV